MIPQSIVDEARNILNTNGVVFGNSSFKISQYFCNPARSELYKLLEKDDDEYDEEKEEKILWEGSITIKSLFTNVYFIAKYRKLEEIYPNLNSNDSLIEVASRFYGVDKSVMVKRFCNTTT